MKHSPLISTSWLKLRSLTNRVWRELGAHAALVGFVLTVIVALLDWNGDLRRVRRECYDFRAQHFQYFSKPPTDRLVHLDIDESSLLTIGRWPWDRSTQAEIIDELHNAGATELSLDILLSEPEKPEFIRHPDNTFEEIDHDANLAAALRRFGKVVVPLNFLFDSGTARTPQYQAMVKALSGDLELEQQEIPLPRGNPPSADDFLAARHEAMGRRLETLLSLPGDHSEEALRHLLLPRADRAAEGSSLQHEFKIEYTRALTNVQISRFNLTTPNPPINTPILDASDVSTMTRAFAEVATSSGFADFKVFQRDTVVDAIPLCISYRDRIYPQMDLALVCLVLNIDAKKIVVEDNQLLLPRPDGSSAVIPLHNVITDNHGKAAMYMDIPWFGGADWKFMYDYPIYQTPKQHMVATLPWSIAEARKLIAGNNARGDEAVQLFARYEGGLVSAKAFIKNPPTVEQMVLRQAGLKAIIDEAALLTGDISEPLPADLSPKEQLFFHAFFDLKKIYARNEADWPIFTQKVQQLRSALQGKAVIIGATATSLGDSQPTPLHQTCPGVVIHGMVFNSIYSAYFWRTAPQWVNALITILVGWITRVIVSRHHALRAVTYTLLLTFSYVLVNCLFLFDREKWIVGIAGPIVAIAVVFVAGTVIRFIAEAQERARITKRFQSYIDPKVVQYYLDHPELERIHGEIREMTVCFTDLAGFTTFTERLRERAVEVLGRYIDKMVPPIRNNGGLIHHRMGDGIMFSFNAPIPDPNMANGAVSAVLDMHAALGEFNEELVAEGYPKLVMRAGVNTGMAVVGDSGSAAATEYACLGDTTNLAARLEGANTATGTRSLVSARTVELLDGSFLMRPVARLVVKGKSEGVMVYEPLARMEAATDEQRRLAKMTQTMFEAYIAANFNACLAAADQLDAMFGPGVLAKLYRELSKKYLTDPPMNFQGLVVLTDKG